MKLYGFTTKFTLDLSEELNDEDSNPSFVSHESDPINIKLLRMHYFFTQNNDINPLIKHAWLEVRITNGPDWSNAIAQGDGEVFEHFNPLHVDRV